MARYRASLHTDRPIDDVFAYLSDFSNSETWDPGVVSAERLTSGTTGAGAEFRLVARFLGSESTLDYRIVEYDAPQVVTFHGENDAVISHDRITFVAAGDGTIVDYDAKLELKGYRRVLDPLVGVAFRRVGERALGGLKRTLAGPQRTLASQ